MSVAVCQGKSVLENSGVGWIWSWACWRTPDLKHMAVSSGRRGGFAPGGAGDLGPGWVGAESGQRIIPEESGDRMVGRGREGRI